MQIANISSTLPSPDSPPLHPAASSPAPSSSVPPAAEFTATPAPSGSPSSTDSGLSQAVAARAEEGVLAAVFTTTIAGKNYSGSVEQSNGVYIGTVPTLSNAHASGSNVESAENNLGAVIDMLA